MKRCRTGHDRPSLPASVVPPLQTLPVELGAPIVKNLDTQSLNHFAAAATFTYRLAQSVRMPHIACGVAATVTAIPTLRTVQKRVDKTIAAIEYLLDPDTADMNKPAILSLLLKNFQSNSRYSDPMLNGVSPEKIFNELLDFINSLAPDLRLAALLEMIGSIGGIAKGAETIAAYPDYLAESGKYCDEDRVRIMEEVTQNFSYMHTTIVGWEQAKSFFDGLMIACKSLPVTQRASTLKLLCGIPCALSKEMDISVNAFLEIIKEVKHLEITARPEVLLAVAHNSYNLHDSVRWTHQVYQALYHACEDLRAEDIDRTRLKMHECLFG